MKRALPLIATLALAACGGGAQLSLSGRAGSVTGGVSPAALALSNGITVDRVRLALREVELERSSGTPDDVKDLQEFETGPMVVDLSGAALNGTVQQVTVQDVPAGSYREIKFKVHPPSMSDSSDPAVMAMASAQAGGASIIVEGQIDGQAYTFLSALDAQEKFEGAFDFSSGAQNVTLNVDPSTWFGGTGASRLDPRVSGNKSAIENNIQASMRLFEDDDHNGADDSTQH
ncbi:MAG TPA: DUF4382 domain-containing protein [Myxococcales bacterium]|nr:DUF4382 domain-containing protein [Myxococcales bacterium]